MTEKFRKSTFHVDAFHDDVSEAGINHYKAFCNQFDRNEHFLLLTLIRLEL